MRLRVSPFSPGIVKISPRASTAAPMMRMIDRIDGYVPYGGRKNLGLIQAHIKVDPEAWFFKAHFYQDPVWPG